MGTDGRWRVPRFAGADAFGPDGARMELRLHGCIPVYRITAADFVQ